VWVGIPQLSALHAVPRTAEAGLTDPAGAVALMTGATGTGCEAVDEQDRATAAESARLDREDELDRAAYRAEAEALTALRETTRNMGIQNVITAANLARDGHDPGWDWQARAATLGIDEYDNPLTKGAATGVAGRRAQYCARTD